MKRYETLGISVLKNSAETGNTNIKKKKNSAGTRNNIVDGQALEITIWINSAGTGITVLKNNIGTGNINIEEQCRLWE